MIITSIVGPFSTMYLLGLPGVLALMLSGSILAVYLAGQEVVPGEIGPGEVFASATATVFVVAYILLLFWMTCWRKLEVYFASTPWLYSASARKAKDGGREYQTRCPFTGLRPSARCPCCQVRTHETAFHRPDRLLNFPGEATVLRWDTAKAAILTEGTPQDVIKARSTLDEALDLRGNQYFGTLTACCVGCATWHRCFNLAPRISLTLALAALFYAYVPWAFATFLKLVGSATGAGVQIACGTLAGGFGLAALLIQVQALCRANAFLIKYQDRIPALQPMFPEPSSALGRWVLRMVSTAPWIRP